MQTSIQPAGLAEGAEIGGKYRLGSLRRVSGRQTDYETIYRGSPALMRVFHCETVGEAAVLAAGFALASGVPHPNLLTVYDFGEDVFEGERIAWIVMERGDECLGEILRERKLEEDEVRQLLEGVRPPLEFLQERRLGHADVRASNVFACGDRIKLSPDRITAEAAEPVAAQTDRLIREVSPVREVVHTERVPTRTTTTFKAPQPKYRKYAGLAIGGALAAAALCALLIRGAHETSSTSHQTVEVVAPAATPAVQAPAAAENRSQVPSGWAIVGGSFNREADAEKRAKEIAGAHPRLEVKVYGAGTSGHRFVIVFGAGLSEAQAKKDAQRARRNGAPRGTYITRFE